MPTKAELEKRIEEMEHSMECLQDTVSGLENEINQGDNEIERLEAELEQLRSTDDPLMVRSFEVDMSRMARSKAAHMAIRKTKGGK